MQTDANRVSLFSEQFMKSIAGLILLGIIALPLSGCGEYEGAGPVVSSLSTPTEDPVSVKREDGPNVDSKTASLSGDENQATDSTENEAQDSETFANIVDPGEEDPAISLTPTSTGVTAQLTWDTSPDPNVQGYFIHYGKQSPGEYGSCSYEQSQRVGPPPATITDLEPNTPYFFAISAFGESESESETPCSNEVLVVTPAIQS